MVNKKSLDKVNGGQRGLEERQKKDKGRDRERAGVRDFKEKKRKDPGKSKRLIDIEKEVSGRVKTDGSWSMKTHSTSGLPAHRGTEAGLYPQPGAAFVGHVSGESPSLLDDPHREKDGKTQ